MPNVQEIWLKYTMHFFEMYPISMTDGARMHSVGDG